MEGDARSVGRHTKLPGRQVSPAVDIFLLILGNGCEMLVAHAAYLAYVAINDRIAGSFMFCGVTVATST